MPTFAAEVREAVERRKRAQLAIYQEAVQRVINIAQNPVGDGGNMPVDTGFLRASIVANLTGDIPPATKPTLTKDGKAAPVAGYTGAEVNLVIQGATLDKPITVAWTAVYAARVEFGFVGQDSLGRTFNQKGRAFLRLAAQNWPDIVAMVTKEANERFPR